ncbi:MAG: YedE-related selenium metabolism membrane protein [Desulfobulbaceae bacterium]|jgi:YedE family putative selenium metabolism protein|nr:YedE-related selenium metabolism membrane protein [Desulfobulbaceae bacterium]
MVKNVFASRWGVIAVGAVIGVLAALLQKLGNPGNMGICVACFERDIAGALGLHRAEIVQYLRPEILGLALGSAVAALATKEFRPRAGSAPIIRFVLGMLAMIGALVFLGCPWRAALRLAGGDGNAIVGLCGLTFGVWVGALFLRRGFSLGRNQSAPNMVGAIFPLIIVGLLALAFIFPQIPDQGKNDVLWYSLKGPGATHAPFFVSLCFALVIGVLAQRSRFCTMGALRDLLLFGNTHLLGGLLALICAALATNLVLGQFHPGFVGQPVAHAQHLWNFAGMTLAGLAFALAGGCPGRQLFLAGEGDGDAAIFVLGMIVGAAVSHNFALASSPAGIGAHGMAAVLIGVALCLAIGFTMSGRRA